MSVVAWRGTKHQTEIGCAERAIRRHDLNFWVQGKHEVTTTKHERKQAGWYILLDGANFKRENVINKY